MIVNLICHRLGKILPVHGHSTASRHSVGLTSPQDDGIQAAHFFLEQTNSVGQGISTEGVGTDQLGKLIGLVLGCWLDTPHLVEFNWDATLGNLVGCFRASQASTDYVDMGCFRLRQYTNTSLLDKLTQIFLILFENQNASLSISACRTSVQPTAHLLN